MKKLLIIPYFLASYRACKLRVGFSGGADSTALLLLLLEWGWLPRQLEAVHFDHGLRGKFSTADGEWCRDFCAALGVDFTLVKLDLSQALAAGGSLEDAARSARLEWYRKHDDRSPVVLAHHAGDVQENMLLKLARGSNVSALTSLRSTRKLWNLTILRPLLEFHKAELEEFLRSRGVTDWRFDASNGESIYHRNFLRNEILSKWSEFHLPLAGGLMSSARVLAMDADFIERAAAEKLARLGETLPQQTLRSYWLDMHEALLGRVLRGYSAELCGISDLSLSRQSIERFKCALQLPVSAESRIIQLNEALRFRLTGEVLELLSPESPPEAILPPQEWDYRQKPLFCYGDWQLECRVLPGAVSESEKGIFYFDADLMPPKLICSMRQGGENMTVWGDKSPRRVKHLLSGTGDKTNMLIVSDAAGQIYMLGDLRRSNLAPVTLQSANTLKIVVKRVKKQ